MTGDRPLRVAISTLGCKVNYAEMAELAGSLAAAGCDVVGEDDHADVRVLNSCTVTVQADATTRQRLRRMRALDPDARIVLTGCSVDAHPSRYAPPRDVSGPRTLPDIDSVFPNARKGEIADYVVSLGAGRPLAVATPDLRARAFIKVQEGCNHRCTYCIVWAARGVSRSVPTDLVASRAREAAARGHAEIVLTGVDLGSYGRDIGTGLARLVTVLLDSLDDGVRIRLSSINANDVTAALVELNAHPRLCSHWHMPLQSGSDDVLRAMHRGYRRAQYLRVVRALRSHDPRTEFTTDIMVGFPGESDADHRDTVSLVDEVGFLSSHVFRWSPRPGTPATELPERVDDRTARHRSAEVRRAAQRTGEASRQRALGAVHDVVWDRVDTEGAHGLAATYHRVVASALEEVRIGSLSRVVANAVEGDALRATLLTS